MKVIRDAANLPDDKQIEVFRTIASFPAILLPVLERTSNELAGVFESSCGVPLQEPRICPQQGGGDISGTAKPVRTRATQRKLLPEVETDDEDDGDDEETEDNASEEERSKTTKRKARTPNRMPHCLVTTVQNTSI